MPEKIDNLLDILGGEASNYSPGVIVAALMLTNGPAAAKKFLEDFPNYTTARSVFALVTNNNPTDPLRWVAGGSTPHEWTNQIHLSMEFTGRREGNLDDEHRATAAAHAALEAGKGWVAAKIAADAAFVETFADKTIDNFELIWS